MDEQDGSKPLVIYHQNCNDGFAAAWVTRKVYPNAEFLPAMHGAEPPNVAGKDVFMLDFAYRRPVMLEMQRVAKSIVVLDHHKTAAEDLKGLDFCIFNMNKSGATITWDYFKDKISGDIPWLVSYTEDRDLWRYQLPFSHEINAVLESYPFDFKIWDALERVYPSAQVTNSPMVNNGRSIIRYQERLIDVIVQHARLVELDGYIIKAANTSCIFSQVANRLAQEQPFGLAWYLREDGKYVHSLRSTEQGADVSQIARYHGGGGHAHSAGFETKQMIFREVE